MKRNYRLAIFLTVIYIIFTGLVFFISSGEKKDAKNIKKDKDNARLDYITAYKSNIPQSFKDWKFYKTAINEKDPATHINQLMKIRKESTDIYGSDFIDEHMSKENDKYLKMAENNDFGGIRERIAGAYSKDRKEKNDRGEKKERTFFQKESGSADRDKSMDGKSKSVETKTPLPDAQNRTQMMALLLTNYFSFSNDIKGFFELSTGLLNDIKNQEDRIYFVEKRAEAVFQFYLREAVINRTAIIDVARTYESELIKSGKDMNIYNATLGGYYYWGGEIRKALDYELKGFQYWKNYHISKNIEFESSESMFSLHHSLIITQFANGNTDSSHEHLLFCLEYARNKQSIANRKDTLWGLYANFLSVNNYMDRVPPEKEFFLGLIMRGYQDNFAKFHLTRYLSTGKIKKFRDIAEKELKEIGEV